MNIINMIREVKKLICLLIYYLFASHLPISYRPYSFFDLPKRIRFFLCKNLFEYCGENVNVEKGVFFGNGSAIRIGNNSGLGINCNVGHVKIGNNVLMGRDVIIMSTMHQFADLNIPIRLQGCTLPKEVTIEDDVWIGHRVIIMPGIKIRKGSIVGAGAVITKDVPEYSIVGGVPAKVIRYRYNRQTNNLDS